MKMLPAGQTRTVARWLQRQEERSRCVSIEDKSLRDGTDNL